MRTDATTRRHGRALQRSRRHHPGDEPPPAPGAILPAGPTRAQILTACAEIHVLDRGLKAMGLPRPNQTALLRTKLAAIAAETPRSAL